MKKIVQIYRSSDSTLDSAQEDNVIETVRLSFEMAIVNLKAKQVQKTREVEALRVAVCKGQVNRINDLIQTQMSLGDINATLAVTKAEFDGLFEEA